MTAALHGFPDWQTSLNTADLVVNQAGNPLNGGGGFFNIGPFDMRLYSSYSVMAEVKTNALATGYNHISMTMIWTSDLGGTNIVYEENFHWFAQDSGFGAFQTDYGRIENQDTIHGPYLRVVFENGGPDNSTCNFNFYGNSRTIARRYLANPFAFSGVGIDFNDRMLVSVLSVALAAGASHNYILRMAPGRASVQFFNNVATGQFQIFMPDGTGTFIWQPAAGVSLYQDITLPRSATRLRVFNFGGAGITYHAIVCAEFPEGGTGGEWSWQPRMSRAEVRIRPRPSRPATASPISSRRWSTCAVRSTSCGPTGTVGRTAGTRTRTCGYPPGTTRTARVRCTPSTSTRTGFGSRTSSIGSARSRVSSGT
jgi:hypothetical protein